MTNIIARRLIIRNTRKKDTMRAKSDAKENIATIESASRDIADVIAAMEPRIRSTAIKRRFKKVCLLLLIRKAEVPTR